MTEGRPSAKVTSEPITKARVVGEISPDFILRRMRVLKTPTGEKFYELVKAPQAQYLVYLLLKDIFPLCEIRRIDIVPTLLQKIAHHTTDRVLASRDIGQEPALEGGWKNESGAAQALLLKTVFHDSDNHGDPFDFDEVGLFLFKEDEQYSPKLVIAGKTWPLLVHVHAVLVEKLEALKTKITGPDLLSILTETSLVDQSDTWTDKTVHISRAFSTGTLPLAIPYSQFASILIQRIDAALAVARSELRAQG